MAASQPRASPRTVHPHPDSVFSGKIPALPQGFRAKSWDQAAASGAVVRPAPAPARPKSGVAFSFLLACARWLPCHASMPLPRRATLHWRGMCCSISKRAGQGRQGNSSDSVQRASAAGHNLRAHRSCPIHEGCRGRPATRSLKIFASHLYWPHMDKPRQDRTQEIQRSLCCFAPVKSHRRMLICSM